MNSKTKKIILILLAVAVLLASGGGIWYWLSRKNADPVYVFPFEYVGMTEYWGDSQESYGPVTTDKIQTVYLTDTQTVTEIAVTQGQSVKRGDLLMSFDTTLSDLALERKRLDVEKLKLQLTDAKKRLQEIRNMKPMVIPEVQEPEENENLGTALGQPYKISENSDYDGSKKTLPLICWISESQSVNDTILEELRLKAEEFQTINANKAAEKEPADETTETEPPQPTEPIEVHVSQFYVVFKTTKGNMSLGQRLSWTGMLAKKSGDGFVFQFFDASAVSDHMLADLGQEENKQPQIDFGSGFTANQLAQMRNEQEKTIKDLEFNIKMAEADYKIAQTEFNDGKIYAQIDGQVVSLLTEEEAKQTMQPILKVSGGGGFYIEGSVSELEKENLKIGQEVTVNDWNTGMTHMGIIQSVGDFPSSNNSWNGIGNPNASYYPFTVFVDGEADLQEGRYVSVMYSTATSEHGIYLQTPFLRTEQGKTYAYVMGENGLLEKRYVTTGKSLWGSYLEILGGLSAEDLVAFPYGKNVKAGAVAEEGDLSDLYR